MLAAKKSTHGTGSLATSMAVSFSNGWVMLRRHERRTEFYKRRLTPIAGRDEAGPVEGMSTGVLPACSRPISARFACARASIAPKGRVNLETYSEFIHRSVVIVSNFPKTDDLRPCPRHFESSAESQHALSPLSSSPVPVSQPESATHSVPSIFSEAASLHREDSVLLTRFGAPPADSRPRGARPDLNNGFASVPPEQPPRKNPCVATYALTCWPSDFVLQIRVPCARAGQHFHLPSLPLRKACRPPSLVAR